MKKNDKVPKASFEQQLFLRRHKRQHREITLFRLVLLALFLLGWEFASDTGRIDSFFFSSPGEIALLFMEKCRCGELFWHIGVTLWETLASFALVFAVSLVLATALWYSQRLSAVAEPYLVVLNSLPKSALAPLLIVWLGTGIKTIIVAGISVAVFGSVISFYTAFRQCDPEKVTLIYTLGGRRGDVFRKVVLPSSIPLLLSTTKVNIGLALVGVIIGEFLAARRGLGYLIIYGSQVFQLDLVIMSIVILCGIAMALYTAIQGLEHRIRKRMGIR